MPAPPLDERLDRLARLRAAVADNEAGFEQAISADFGHRSVTETMIAETMMVFGEIRHAAKHLKKWDGAAAALDRACRWAASARRAQAPITANGVFERSAN